MPKVLSIAEVNEFRERLCLAAERLFAERGPEAVTMRQLAAELGVSPMTPYRYFRDKDDILAAVRTKGFNQFAQVLEAARASVKGAPAKEGAVGEAYLTFAFGHPQTYKLMFDLEQPCESNYPDLAAAGARARGAISGFVSDLIVGGDLTGDPQELSLMFWAAIHGPVMLELAGKARPGAARALNHALFASLLKGLRADA